MWRYNALFTSIVIMYSPRLMNRRIKCPKSLTTLTVVRMRSDDFGIFNHFYPVIGINTNTSTNAFCFALQDGHVVRHIILFTEWSYDEGNTYVGKIKTKRKLANGKIHVYIISSFITGNPVWAPPFCSTIDFLCCIRFEATQGLPSRIH